MKLLNWSRCKAFMLGHSARTRHAAYVHTRVSRAGVEALLEARLRDEMRRIVDGQPSRGKTIQVP